MDRRLRHPVALSITLCSKRHSRHSSSSSSFYWQKCSVSSLASCVLSSDVYSRGCIFLQILLRDLWARVKCLLFGSPCTMWLWLCLRQAMRGGGYVFTRSRFSDVPYRLPAVPAFLLRTNTGRILMKFGEGIVTTTNRWTDYILWAKLYQWQGSRTQQKIRIDVKSGLPRIANNFTNFTVHTARCVRRAGQSIMHMQLRRHHMFARGL